MCGERGREKANSAYKNISKMCTGVLIYILYSMQCSDLCKEDKYLNLHVHIYIYIYSHANIHIRRSSLASLAPSAGVRTQS